MSDEKTTVIIVTEAPVGDRAPVERRYDANQADTGGYDHGGHLRLLRKGAEVAVYQGNAWLSWREEDALVPDGTKRALVIAKRALEAIAGRAEGLGRTDEDAQGALDEIAELDL